MKTSAVFLSLTLLACSLWIAAKNPDIRPNGRRHYPRNSPQAIANRTHPPKTGLTYHGGPLILGTVNLYYVNYGNWSGNSAPTVLADLATSIGGSPYFLINAGYSDSTQTKVSGTVKYGGATTDAYSQGKALSDAQILTVIGTAISSGKLPKDPNGVYLLLASADVTASSGMCTAYCGWHSHASVGGTEIKYGFIGNPDRCPSACAEQAVGPNGTGGADAMASIIAHELEEAVTDPTFSGYFDRRGYENADLCAWQFGVTYAAANGAKANMKLGTRDFLIQQNINLSTMSCALR